jgi:hypothetical protein
VRELVPHLWRGHLFLASIVGIAWTLYAPLGAFVLTFIICTYLEDVVAQVRWAGARRPRGRRAK